MTSNNSDKIPLGWREYVGLPDWGIRVRAKVDTGARTSAIHVDHVEPLDGDRIRFEVVVKEKPERQTVWIEADLVREATVKPSHGKRQNRPVVRTVMKLGGVRRRIELSLVCRRGMLCRMLIGRRALEGRYVVDPEHKYLARSRKRQASPESEGRS